jgi:DNA-binding MarR family transcriptional regulator
MTGGKDVKQLTRSPYHLLKRSAQYAAAVYADAVGKSGLTQRQFTVLLAADENDGVSQTALVKCTGIDRSTLADLVARLMAQGYLQRRRTKDDGRTNSVRLTAQGKKMLKMAQPGAEEVDKQIMAIFPTAQRKAFIDGLVLLADAMDKQEASEATKAPPRAKGRRRT